MQTAPRLFMKVSSVIMKTNSQWWEEYFMNGVEEMIEIKYLLKHTIFFVKIQYVKDISTWREIRRYSTSRNDLKTIFSVSQYIISKRNSSDWFYHQHLNTKIKWKLSIPKKKSKLYSDCAEMTKPLGIRQVSTINGEITKSIN